ncbi:bifunctional glutamate/proline--tRNA ligase-like isoform X2 [Bolinopsis microptera]
MEKWKQMVAGTDYGKKCCLRAKMDMQSDNGCLRDPAMYRCKDEPHPRHGNKYKVYPTYDFACPIVDSVEGVTHALRTTEYNDRDPQYYWFIDQLGLRRPFVYAYARLNLTHTVLSKRKLAWFVEQGLVSGWDDPRFPTVRGILRRGMTVEALKQFIILQGSARSVVVMGWDKIWTINKKIIDPIAPRFTGLGKETLVPVKVLGVESSVKKCAKHPKNTDVGEKDVYYGSKVYLEGEDAENLKPGEKITMINWGNMLVDHISRSDNKVTDVTLKPVLDDTDFKKTAKLTWLADVPQNIPAVAVHYDNIISKAVLGKEEDFKSFIGHQTVFETELIGDSCLGSLKKGDIIQLQRRGYYICDSPYQAASEFTGLPMPCMLVNIPDGRLQVPPTPAATAKPSTALSTSVPAAIPAPASSGNADKILEQIAEQGNVVRDLKAAKAGKDQIKPAVDQLLAFKKQYKDLTGVDAPAGGKPAAKPAPASSVNADKILEQIAEQGNVVRDLKAAKAGKDQIKPAVDQLLAFKKQYKDLTGVDAPAGGKPAAKPAPAPASSGNADKILEQIAEQGNVVRDLKAAKAGKDQIKPAVDQLLAFKKQYKDLTGVDAPAGGKPAAKPAPASSGNADKILEQIAEQGNVVRDLKAAKAGKDQIKPAVDQLLAFKKQYKDLTGVDAPAGGKPAAKPAPASSGNADKILEQIAEQGNVVRDLKAAKAGKDQIKPAVDQLLAFKKQYKDLTGVDAPAGGKPAAKPTPASSGNADKILEQIAEQGNVVRDLKAAKAGKDQIKPAVDQLLAFKKQYKDLTGLDAPAGGKPAAKPAPVAATPPPAAATGTSNSDGDKILEAIFEQGNVVRQLKSNKAPKPEVTAAVQLLLKHKAEYKALTGKDAPAGGKAPSSEPVKTMSADSGSTQQLEAQIKEQGDKVRAAKGSGASKDEVQGLVKELLKLKTDYKTLTGNDPPGAAPQQSSKQKKKEKKAPAPKPKIEAGVTRLGIEAKKFEDLPNWYSQVITKSEMIEYYDVSGCYILRPWSFFIWEIIQKWFDTHIKAMGVTNCYFPMFVSHAALEKEKTHIADFAPEVAWVTKSGDSELAEPIAIRPTSETVMYPSYATWVQSHRDLPIKLNQWCNVVRWEFKHPQPFLRTREFLWQEGHSAFATQKEAHEEVFEILDLYHGVYKELLAIPTVKGKKTEKEKFAGGDFTTTVEGYVSATGRGIQGATSHHLGQNFSKMFNIQFEDPDSTTGDKLFAHQNSWGLSTRSIGVVVMVHGDNKGLVLPPRVAMYQAVIVPCGVTDANKDQLNTHCTEMKKTLQKAGVRTHADLRENYNTGWKFNHWELKGVPVRIEIGPRDLKNNQVVVVRRDTGVKATLQNENLDDQLSKLLDTIHDDMYNRALVERDANMAVTTNWEEFCKLLDQKKIIQAPYCGDISCEEIIKKESARTEVTEDDKAPAMGAKSLCIPFDQPADATCETCIQQNCCKPATAYTLFGRSY